MNQEHHPLSEPPNPYGRFRNRMYRGRLRFYERLYRLVRYHAWWVLFTSLLLSTLALFYIRDLPIRQSMLDLLPQDDPLLEQFKLRGDELQQSDSLVILLELVQPPATPEAGLAQLQPLAELTAQRLMFYPEIDSASYELDPKILTFKRLASDEARLAEFEDAVARLQAGAGDLSILIQEDFADQYSDIINEIFALTQGEDLEAAKLSELINILELYHQQLILALNEFPAELDQLQTNVDRLLQLLLVLEQELQTPTLDASQDGRYLRLVVGPSQPSFVNLNFNIELVDLVRQTLGALVPPDGSVNTYISGSYSFTAESNQALRLDMFYTTLISVIGILFVFVLTFRGFIYPALVIIPLTMGAVWTTAWAKYALEGFNLVTSLLPALLLGLSINYGIHFVGRYLEERQQSKSVSHALHEAILNKTGAMLSGAITTALVFFVMMLSRSRGLYEMGLVAGFGVLASVTLTLLVLPSLIVVSHLVLRRRLLRRRAGYRWNLSWLIRAILRAPTAIILVIGLVTVALVVPASQVSIRFISEELIVSGLPTQEAQEVMRNAGFPETEGIGDFFLFFVPTEDAAEALEQVLRGMDDLVLEVRSVRDYFEQASALQSLDVEQPFEEGERLINNLLSNLKNKDQLAQLLTDMEDNFRLWKERADIFGQRELVNVFNRIITQLIEIQQGLDRLDVNELQLSLLHLQNALRAIQQIADRTLVLPKTIEDFLNAMPEELRSKFITSEDELIVFTQVSKDIYLEGNYERFTAMVDTITTNYVGLPMIQHQLEIAMEHDFWVSTLSAFGLILMSLLIDFSAYRMYSAPLFVLLPLSVGYVWMLGGMGLLRFSFNLTNMMISPLLIGIGVDNGIHLMHRYLESSPNDPHRVQRAAESVAMPILISNMATMVAFGSLLFASTPGLQVLGKSALIGVGSVAFCSLTLLPAVLAKRR